MEETETKRGKGRPATPCKLERLAFAMGLVRGGKTFSAASKIELRFGKFDVEGNAYVLDEDINDKLPGPKRRRIALHQIKRELLAPWERRSGQSENLGAYTMGEITFNGRPLRRPIAIAAEGPFKRGRPKKR